jgi:hypothetical protein
VAGGGGAETAHWIATNRVFNLEYFSAELGQN